MKLSEQRSPSGERLNKALEARLLAVAPSEAAATELYVHLWDIHDGSRKLARWIEELTELDPQHDLSKMTSVLYRIQIELFDHLLPHMEQLRPELEVLCARLADRDDVPPPEEQ